MTKPRPTGWRILSSAPSEAPSWSSREDQARAARLDRELDALAAGTGGSAGGPAGTGGSRGTGGPAGGSAGTGGSRGIGGPGELVAALQVAAGLRILAEHSLVEPPDEALVALRAAAAAMRGRGPWRSMTPTVRFALSGAGAVAAAIVGAVAWAGLINSSSPGVHKVDLLAVTEQLTKASNQIVQANQALANGDPVAAQQDLVAAQATEAKAAAQLQPDVQSAVGPRSQTASLAAALAQAQTTISSLQQVVNSLEVTTTTVPATSSTAQGTGTTTTSTTTSGDGGGGGGVVPPNCDTTIPSTSTTTIPSTSTTTTPSTSTPTTSTTSTTTASLGAIARLGTSEVKGTLLGGLDGGPRATNGSDLIVGTPTSTSNSTTTTTEPVTSTTTCTTPTTGSTTPPVA